MAALTSLLAASAAGAGALGGGQARGASTAGARPNVVLIETDDQTLESNRVMSNVRSRIAAKGASFAHNYVNFSLCCPSRATVMTGQYAHNHQVLGNTAPEGGFDRFQSLHARNNLAVWLKRAGYSTALIGKYLNGYGVGDPTLVPPGWTEWYAASNNTTQAVYDYDLNENGALVHYGNAPADFKQDVLTAKAVDFIDRRALEPSPWFLWLSYTAPHIVTGVDSPSPLPPFDCQGSGAPQPAVRHATAFDSEPLPTPPSFNEADVSDKPAWVRDKPPLSGARIDGIARRYHCELESLLSVDEGVGEVVDALQQSGQLSNTYLIVTSDNGFHHGEHRIPGEKSSAYEESIRVPLAIRGPGIRPGARVRDLTINADLAPTIANIAGAEPKLDIDGRSLLAAAKAPGRETGRELEIEARRGGRIPTYRAIHTQRYVYVRYRSGARELYDLEADPYELGSLHHRPAYRKVKARLSRRLDDLQHCAGPACRFRPRLALDLLYRAARRDGHRCALDPIRAAVVGKDSDHLVRAEFYVDHRRVAIARRPPFVRKLPPGDFHPHGGTPVRVRATLLDGRRMTLDRSVRAC